jgi:hypothetical protein
MLATTINLFKTVPDNSVLARRADNEAYALVERGSLYAIYFTGRADRSVKVDLSVMEGPARQLWLDIEKSRWRVAKDLDTGLSTVLATPGQGQWVALILPFE